MTSLSANTLLSGLAKRGNPLPGGPAGGLPEPSGLPSFSALLRDNVVAAPPQTPPTPPAAPAQPPKAATPQQPPAQQPDSPPPRAVVQPQRPPAARPNASAQQPGAKAQDGATKTKTAEAAPARTGEVAADAGRSEAGRKKAAADGDAATPSPASTDAAKPPVSAETTTETAAWLPPATASADPAQTTSPTPAPDARLLPQAAGDARAPAATPEDATTAAADPAATGRAGPVALDGKNPAASPAPADKADARATAASPRKAGETPADAASGKAAATAVGADSFAARLEQAQQATPTLPQGAEALLAARHAGAIAENGNNGAPPTPRAVELAQPLYSPEFAPEMAARISVLAADGVQQAELHLNPAEMGPVQIQIVVDGQQAQISFHSEQADTRAVLERGLPELASALRENGLTLSGGGVFQQPRDAQQQQPQAGDGSNSGRRNNAGAEANDPLGQPAAAAARPAPRARGVVDLYA
ncbi:hypothetical protein G8A07_09365 [Roseateles sp. DAIF2]|uniref:flagellar hook-length control protein FliK n=1 Tax=Roseateles sp. DAIF2 TaxID=2714952 RepID=UPI0018A248E2|nr:flagellar hook-length control protein FliK [Roseateles sp. DAIF2]QPF73106.1 hypothetical protein G8A07_09365 [Roseateles sp. DAIF2]